MKTFICALVITIGIVGIAQEKKIPELTEVQRLKIQNLTQRLEIAQLRAQIAQRDFDNARGEFSVLLKELEVKDYIFNVDTLSYSKNPESPKEK